MILEFLDALYHIFVFIFWPVTFIIGFFINIHKEKFVGLYMSINECKIRYCAESYIGLIILYIINTGLFIMFLPARMSNFIIRITKIKGNK